MNKDITIWQVYHDKSFEKDLKENVLPYYKSFYTQENLEGDSINDMQRFINEFVCQYYVYKNNIKSDIVGFCQYWKYFEGDVDKIDFNKLTYIILNEVEAKAISGCDRAIFSMIVAIALPSVASRFKNFLLAGILAKRFSTITLVPFLVACSLYSTISPA